jgi:hypothetical protein
MSLTNVEKKLQRIEQILFSFINLKFATREQLQKLHNLGSDRNALKVIRELNEYLTVQTHGGRNVYYLNKAGRELVGEEHEIKWNTRVDHHLMRNDLYLYFQQPNTWEVEKGMSFKAEGLTNKEYTLVPDARFHQEGQYHFIEVDRMQSMNENKKKISLYKLIHPLINKQFQKPPIVVFYTLTSIRKEKLKEMFQKEGIPCLVYTKEDLF